MFQVFMATLQPVVNPVLGLGWNEHPCQKRLACAAGTICAPDGATS